CLLRTTNRIGVADAVESIFVRHVSGGTSELTLKYYDMRREAFQGMNRDLIWLDEEPERDIYVECLLRTMTTNGLLMATFPPLMGMTDICRDYLQKQETDSTKYVVTATWDDVPH